MDDAEEEKEIINLKDIRARQGFNFKIAKSKPKPRQASMDLDIEEENVQLPKAQKLTATEKKSKDLIVALDKIGNAMRLLTEAQGILLTHDLHNHVQNIAEVVDINLRSLEDDVQRTIVEICDGPVVQARPPSPKPVVNEAPAAALENDMDSDAALAAALQAEEQEQQDLRIAHQLQQQEQQKAEAASMRAMHRHRQEQPPRSVRVQRDLDQMPHQHMDFHQQLQGLFHMPDPHSNIFADSDSDDDIFSFNGHRFMHRGPLPPHIPHGFDGDMDDILRALEMQDRGANQHEIAQFSNEEKFHVRKHKNSSNSEAADSPDNNDHSEQCCICMEAFVEGDKIRRLPCLHIFHTNEIDQWLTQNSTCPICKTDIQQAG